MVLTAQAGRGVNARHELATAAGATLTLAQRVQSRIFSYEMRLVPATDISSVDNRLDA